MHSIRSTSIELNLCPEEGYFSIHPVDERYPGLEQARLGCEYFNNRVRDIGLTGPWNAGDTIQSTLPTLEHGNIETVTFCIPADTNGIAYTLTFGVTQEHPLVLWKVSLHNQGNQAVKVRQIDLLKLDQDKKSRMRFQYPVQPAELGFLSNGWQSWSPSRWYRGDSGMTISRLGLLQHPMIYNPGTPKPRRKGVFSSDMFGVITDQNARTGFLVGFLAQKNHFGTIVTNFYKGELAMWANGDDAVLPGGGEMETDWAVYTPLRLDHRDPLEVYLEAVGRENHALVPKHTPTGWCSWYQYYTNVTAEDMERNLDTILDLQERLPIDIVQLDDGFESCVGDWYTFMPTFPDGVAPLAQRISQQGLVPGIWLAPFIVNPRSRLMREHKDWLLFSQLGRPVNAGYGWNVLTSGLDLTVPEALGFVRDVAKTAVEKWGYKYLKLDFYYAAGLKGHYHDPTKTRAQVLRMGMQTIRDAVGPDVTLLGCGAPLGSMIGIVDMMRIGPDVSGDWSPNFRGIKKLLKSEPSMPCARNSIQNIIARAGMHRKWWINDPDCLLVRPDSNLTLPEVQSLATAIGLTGGALLISDDLTKLPAERLAIAEALVPTLDEPVRVLDLLNEEIPSRLRLDLLNSAGASHALCAFNWTDQPEDMVFSQEDFRLENGDYLYREFWSGKCGVWNSDKHLSFPKVPSHGCVAFTVRRLQGQQPMYVGSDLHISQGVELEGWQEGVDGLNITLRLPRSTTGNLYLYLPGEVSTAVVNEVTVELQQLNGSIYRLPVEVEGFCHIHILSIKK